MRPLEPVLRSNFWLVTHVMTIALSYAAFALALGIANITLGYYAFRSREQRIRFGALSQFTYQSDPSRRVAVGWPELFWAAYGRIILGAGFGAGIRRKSGPWLHCWVIWPCSMRGLAARSATEGWP